MNRFVALLRAINVGGHARVSMADLRELITSLGFEEVKSVLQTGNLVFLAAKDLCRAEAERMLEHAAVERLGLKTAFLVRSAKEMDTVIADNPFPGEAHRDPGHLAVFFLKSPAREDAVLRLQAMINGPEVVRACRGELYIVYPEGMGRSRLTSRLIEKELETCGTGRNWNTVLKIGDMMGEKA